ncbi:hypothetical protein [Glaciimonas soli]|uniref:Uncharacterized protein n=1 Tax=Glaciimonas soli TaxID=2590999 RepID=A0A843YP72_9BURK|nr:hypothetical protein [Glaciimonas soli]MQR01285.1 hypothetical protein [Glaciimonas soli]
MRANQFQASNFSFLPSVQAQQHVAKACIMDLTISTECVTQLRRLVMAGGVVTFIRIQPMAHATRMRVWLGLSTSAVNQLMISVMQNLPSAEFGKIKPC